MNIHLRAMLFCAAAMSALAVRAFAADDTYRTILDRYHAAGAFDGIAAVQQDGRIVFEGAAGEENREKHEPHQVTETFRIASVTKQFTALLIMQEVGRGKISLDAPASQYLPWLPAAAKPITIRQLLANTSGLPNLDQEPGFYTRAGVADAPLAQTVGSLRLEPLVFPPGSKFSYNNSDFFVLGAVLEAVEQRSFRTLLEERILKALGMKNSGLYGAQGGPGIRGYEKSGKALVPENTGIIGNYGPAGAMFSTLGDMTLWNRALLDNRLLSKPLTTEMFTGSPQLGFVALGSWSYDLRLASGSSVHLVERQGNIGGVQILNVLAPSSRTAFTIVANTDDANLFSLYTRTGLPYDLISAALTK